MVLPPLPRVVGTAAAEDIPLLKTSVEAVAVTAGKPAAVAVAGAEEVVVVTVATEGVAAVMAVAEDAEVCYKATLRSIAHNDPEFQAPKARIADT